ncbi:unnamed protein product [Diatraea saccharalis]|uniref:CUB domain-containing protein n=1 Tax=Diatraea saccharalis TaxID=40085 RepID=A0A9N9WBX6_9NEOP|nr:unnamed protein product [Diatraea saccharalis]
MELLTPNLFGRVIMTDRQRKTDNRVDPDNELAMKVSLSACVWTTFMDEGKHIYLNTLSVHYCNREVQVAVSGEDSEGYIRTPGYPNFYVGDVCRWRLRASPEQHIRVTLLDVSLRSVGPFEDSCVDYVSVQDSNGDSMLSSCEQVDLPLRLTAATNVVDVLVEAKSKGAYPKRGVLLHYKSIGCVTLPAPSNGYLVYRNEEVAHYMCNVNHVFIDTRQRARLLWCYDDNRWNDTVPFCIDDYSAFGLRCVRAIVPNSNVCHSRVRKTRVLK